MSKQEYYLDVILGKTFFERPVLKVALELPGKCLVRRTDGKTTAYLITEVEAYDGVKDKACHASRGRTARTEVMFGEAGHWYVYLCYGMYEMLNIVTGPSGYPAAVLIRGTKEVSGPGRLTKSLNITRALNTKPATKKSALWIEDRGIVVPKQEIARTSRIGVAYAGEWAQKPWRFLWVANEGQ
jgi:DNA-3-methyladenine glycosylase